MRLGERSPFRHLEHDAESAIAAAGHHRVFELHPYPMWVFDLDTLQILDVNRAAVYHYGYSRSEFLELTIRDLRPSDDIPYLDDYLPSTRDNPHPATTLWRHKKKDGSVIEVEVSSFRVEFRTRPAKLVLITDVTEKKHAERTVFALEAAIASAHEERQRTALSLHEISRSTCLEDAKRIAIELETRMLGGVPAVDEPPASSTRDNTSALSAREREVLERVAHGHTNREVADELGLSIKSVEAYRSRFMGKLGLRNRAEVVRYSLECGLLGREKPDRPCRVSPAAERTRRS